MPRLTREWRTAEALTQEWGKAAPDLAGILANHLEVEGLLPAAKSWREVRLICEVMTDTNNPGNGARHAYALRLE